MTDAQKLVLREININQIDALQALARDMFLNWSTTTIKKETEFETMWMASRTEGKIIGINEFIQQIEDAGASYDRP